MVAQFRVIADRMPEVEKALKKLKESAVMVGIPDKSKKRQGKRQRITNAQLLYIHTHGIRRKKMRKEMQQEMNAGRTYSEAYQLYLQEHGSPLWHSPPRPVLEPAIKDKKEWIAEQLSKAATAALDGNIRGVNTGLHSAGKVAENAARDWFTNPHNGWAPNSPKTVKLKESSNPLIDTDQMRKSITHVIRQKGENDD